MSRSKWKIPVCNFKLGSEKITKRNSLVPSIMINKLVQIYTGKQYVKVRITREKVGFKYGFFCFSKRYTRKIIPKKIKKLKNAKK
jgi:ribosomal protein S19